MSPQLDFVWSWNNIHIIIRLMFLESNRLSEFVYQNIEKNS